MTGAGHAGVRHSLGSKMKHILFLVGTRPEGIKLAPVIHACRRLDRSFRTTVCATGQHKEILSQALADFSLVPDHFLEVMRPGQSLPLLTSRLMDALDSLFRDMHPDWIVVQGDTTTVMVASLCAFYHRMPLAHVEAGLRSGDRYAPFPEEVNRKITSLTADLHFAPTTGARDNLLSEGVPPDRVHVTGNTVIDALLATVQSLQREPPPLPVDVEQALADKKRTILVTAHRRESFGAGLHGICRALRHLALRYPDTGIIYPVHPNPRVRETVASALSGVPGILLTDPLPYRPFVRLLSSSYLVLTDSGGIQEEAPSLDIPVLVMRDVTERPEGVEAGCAMLVGTDPERIEAATAGLLTDPARYSSMAAAVNPYGNGMAGERIARIIAETGEA